MQNKRQAPLVYAAVVMFLAALLHIVALLVGPKMIAYLGAPPPIVQSAEQGTPLATVSCIVIAVLLVMLGCYAMGAAGKLRRLPLTAWVMNASAVVFLLRAVAFPVVLVAFPATRAHINTFEVASSLLCLTLAYAFAADFRNLRLRLAT